MRLIDADKITEDYIIDYLAPGCDVELVPDYLDLIQNQPTVDVESMGKWIPVEEELPKEERSYLVTILDLLAGTKYVDRCYFFPKAGKVHGMDDETHWFEENRNLRVLAWQPLPMPYEEH